jgi:hypothetical protein
MSVFHFHRFIHSPLKRTSSDDIHCEILTKWLDKSISDIISYEALSYTWELRQTPEVTIGTCSQSKLICFSTASPLSQSIDSIYVYFYNCVDRYIKKISEMRLLILTAYISVGITSKPTVTPNQLLLQTTGFGPQPQVLGSSLGFGL